MEGLSTAEPFRFAPASAGAGGSALRTPGGGGASGERTSAEAIVDQTRREIAGIVRETAQLARRDQPPEVFFAALVDRVLRAMAAEGVVVWRVEPQADPRTFVPVARVGRITDRSLRTDQRDCHHRMLAAVADGGQPTVVPATPEACDASLPANPTQVPAAVVPVAEVDRCDFLLEVFLEPAGGLATQRGYLRFAAQMADLAGEFLRLHRLRQADRAQQRWQRMARVLPSLHRSLDQPSTMAAVVDGAAEALAADRVSLCRVHGGRATVLAVSHVPNIDRTSPAARYVAQLALRGDGRHAWFPASAERDAAADDPAAENRDGTGEGAEDAGDDALDGAIAGGVARGAGDDVAGDAPDATAGPRRGELAPPDDAPLRCEAVLPLDGDGHLRLVVQSVQPADADASRSDDLRTFAAHAAMALQNARIFGAIPWGRAAAALAPASMAAVGVGRTRWMMAAAAGVLLTAVALLPVPLVVRGHGELRPVHTSIVYAPRAGTVSEVLVEHGQHVRSGDLLVRLVDRQLEQEYEALLGRRAVLEQRAAELGSALVDQSLRGQRDQSQQLQADQRVLDQERAAVEAQLALLMRERDSLELRSDRDGVVEGWQLRRQWNGRPVDRGQMLLSVTDPHGPWDVEAWIPQSRLDHVLRVLEPPDALAVNPHPADATPAATVLLQAQPDRPLAAALHSVGPALHWPTGDAPAGRALLRITSTDLPDLQTGAPAEVAIACGRRPLAYIALQDLIRVVRGRWNLYVAH